ncbi:afadin- and alpha-actinin-binding protein-like isoform X2 [Tachysurus fulvidraco]|uniref:afadin- and alpha-actinin-binding protein-like isoform X2 n=1 Tax=Tachysurus fulvidraco TaxID=1234273 RepID=UPI000F5148BC|nr:afadin- and alpha-actinin-binding protein-like isoform X2 [Tachysurus fulvidraco]
MWMYDFGTLKPETITEDINLTMPPARPYSQAIRPPLPFRAYSGSSVFCTEENVSECMQYIDKELLSLGLPSIFYDSNRNQELDIVLTLNNLYDLLQLNHFAVGNVDEHEAARLKDQLELSMKENGKLCQREQQLENNIKALQRSLKNEKKEVQKLRNIIASRATQYNHSMKRKEREFNKLKEHLNQLLTDKKDMKQRMEVLKYFERSDDSPRKTGRADTRHESEVCRTLLNEFDKRQRELMLENFELKKVLQQMKQEMVVMLSPKDHFQKQEKFSEFTDQQLADEEETSFNGTLEMSCEHAREKLTNSIRQQWRKLKHHMESLDNKAFVLQSGKGVSEEMISKQVHQEETEKLKMEIQQCMDFIQTQQQLLQQQLNTQCDEETAAVLNDCYMLEEKERLKEEWMTFEEQRKNFEMERRSFTEAAIRLGHERKMFEEDRATWLKHQFLNMTFTEQMRSHNVISEYSGQEQKHISAPKTPL